jgi:hypothetical protein
MTDGCAILVSKLLARQVQKAVNALLRFELKISPCKHAANFRVNSFV